VGKANLVIFLVIAVAGCGTHRATRDTDGPRYDVPPQVIYRIDDHRFISLENYKDCQVGTSYYIDTRKNIRIELGRGTTENYLGRLINADPTEQNIVVPSSRPPNYPCSDRGCSMPFYYSTDGGKSFQRGDDYMRYTWRPYQDSKNYIISVTSDRLYVAKDRDGDYYVTQYPLIPGIDLKKPYPPGVRGAGFLASKRPNYLDGLRTPSGQEYIKCDDSIRPANAPKGKK